MPLLQLLCVAALCATSQDPVQVDARLSDSRVMVGEATTLLISVETDGAAPETIRMAALPDGLDVVGTSDYSQTQIRMPGGRTRVTRRDIVILPRAPGVYRIPPVRIQVRGTLYSTRPLDLVVTGSAAEGETPGTSMLQVRLAPDTVYVGEQVLLYAEATFSEQARLRQSRPPSFDPPAPTGFWVQDLPDPVTVMLRVRGGRSVESQTFRRAYFPLRAGEYRLPPARLHYEVRRGFLYAPETRELVSDSARLVVLPLPQDGRPASFNGAVGRLRMQTSVAPARVVAGEPAVVTIEFEGAGNVKALPAPVLPDLQNAEVFPPTQESEVRFNGDEVGGLKRFRWIIVPEEAGALVVPPVEYAYFDPELGEYVELRSDTLRIEAAPAPAVVAGEASAAAGQAGERGIRGLRRQTGGDRLTWVRSPAFVAAQALPLLLLGGLVAVRRRHRRPPSATQRVRSARRRLGALGPDADAAEIERILCSAVLQVLEEPEGDAVERLRSRGRTAAAERLDALLRELHRVRYEPGARFDRAALIREADAFLASLSPRSPGSGRNAGTHLVLIALMAVLLVSLPTGTPAAAQDPSFDRAIELFEQGLAAHAANEFHAYAVRHPGDVDAWYNAGVAAWHAGDRGRAVWAWLRTLRLAPRDADVLHNLREAGAGLAAARVRPPDRLSTSERALAASIGWWLLLGSLGGAVLGRRRALWAAVPATALLAAAGLAALTTAGRSTIVVPMRDGAALYAAPTIREESIGTLPPGGYALLLERRDDWLLVRTEAGTDAWVERLAVAAP